MSEVISLILHIQNDEAKINLSLDEQPDLKKRASEIKKSGLSYIMRFMNTLLKRELKNYYEYSLGCKGFSQVLRALGL